MLRVRIDGGALTPDQLRVVADISPRVRPRHRRHHRPPEHPAPLDPRRGRARDLAPPRGRRPADHRGLRRHPARHPRLPGRRHRGRRAHRPDAGHRRDHSTASSATPSSPTCRASSSRPSPATRATTSCTRSTTSPSSASSTPSSASATTCGSAAASRRAPRLAERLGVFVAPEQVAEVWHGVIRDLPRLRLPPAAQQGAPEVPARRVGPREVPPGAPGRVPRLRAARRTRRPAPRQRTRRPRRRAPAEGRQLLHRRRPDRRPRLRRRARRARRPRRGRRLRPAAPHPAPEARRPRRPRRPRRRRSWPRARRARPDGTAQPLPPRHDRVHRHRVLQARHRRDQGDAPPTTIAELEQRLADVRPADTPITLHVNGCPNSCARIQIADIGLKGQLVHDRRRAGARLPGAPRRRPRLRRPRRGRPRPHRPRPQGDRRRTCPTTSSASCARFLDQREAGETFAEWAHRADEEALR